MKRLFVLLMSSIVVMSTYAQGFQYDEKKDLGNNLYKVKSGNFYGIIDSSDKVVVSMEYEDIVFKDGKALLTKENKLLGIVDLNGKVKKFSGIYLVHPQFRFVYDGYIPVKFVKNPSQLQSAVWGFVDENERPFKITQKIEGVRKGGKEIPTLFDYIHPFVEGIAAVYVDNYGWKHVDTNGVERYALNDIDAVATLRTSPYKGECIIATADGIRLCQEQNKIAVVKQILAPSDERVNASGISFNADTSYSRTDIHYRYGTLTMDSLMRAYKFEYGGESIYFIEKPKPKEEPKKTQEILLGDNVKVSVGNSTIYADINGRAKVEVKVTNTSKEKFDEVDVLFNCNGIEKKWSGPVPGNKTIPIKFDIPARFSEAYRYRKATVKVIYKNQSPIEETFNVKIMRYNPSRR